MTTKRSFPLITNKGLTDNPRTGKYIFVVQYVLCKRDQKLPKKKKPSLDGNVALPVFVLTTSVFSQNFSVIHSHSTSVYPRKVPHAYTDVSLGEGGYLTAVTHISQNTTAPYEITYHDSLHAVIPY